ncbi:substrate-binding domain-containing protein [Brachybacterium sp.]|uniref:LacI family DNA-binding transcriptional regulator n=1 Tax=Brachybacterium sp. TaxID=1891286 RepID=UPI002ED054C6
MATIGITIPESVWSARSERYYAQVLHGLEDTAVAHGHAVLSRVTGSVEEELEVLRSWAALGMVDVVILKDLLAEDPRPAQVRALGLPFTMIGDVRQRDVSAVAIDNAGTMRHLLEDLHECGHRAIGHVGGPAHLLHSRWRREAYQEVVDELGLPTLVAEGDYGAESGAAATRDLLRAPVRPTVIVHDNDAMAIGGVGAAVEEGLRIPADLSVVAWDDSPACQTHAPPIAVLDHLPHQLGVDLGIAAVALVEAPERPVRLALEVPRLLHRGTLQRRGATSG